MYLLRHFALLLLLLTTPPITFAQDVKNQASDDMPCGILYGKGHSFSVCAPKGWVLDNSVLNDQGIHAVFYPVGSSWNEAKKAGSVMYVNTSGKESAQQTLEEFVKFDVEQTRKAAPKVEVKPMSGIKTRSTSSDELARVQRYEHSDFDRSEAIAYLESPEVFIMIVLTSRDDEAFRRDYPSFEQLVKCYFFLSSNVTFPKK